MTVSLLGRPAITNTHLFSDKGPEAHAGARVGRTAQAEATTSTQAAATSTSEAAAAAVAQVNGQQSDEQRPLVSPFQNWMGGMEQRPRLAKLPQSSFRKRKALQRGGQLAAVAEEDDAGLLQPELLALQHCLPLSCPA